MREGDELPNEEEKIQDSWALGQSQNQKSEMQGQICTGSIGKKTWNKLNYVKSETMKFKLN